MYLLRLLARRLISPHLASYTPSPYWPQDGGIPASPARQIMALTSTCWQAADAVEQEQDQEKKQDARRAAAVGSSRHEQESAHAPLMPLCSRLLVVFGSVSQQAADAPSVKIQVASSNCQ